jgi:alpha-L-fucosidase
MSSVVPLEKRIKWFQEARFGMFVHFGIYSVLGRGEQIMSRDLMPLSEYEPYAQQFNPKRGWADALAHQAVDAGMKYIVLTTRHHDGYCLFDTKTTDFNAAKTGPGRDLIAEYVEAARKKGLKVAFYYSVQNWRWKGFWDAKKYPEDLPKIVEELHTQVRELMTNYGKIDVLWYDVPAVPGFRVPGMWGGTGISSPAEFYKSEPLNAMVRELQPHILINNRSGVPEDFGTPEQKITPQEQGAWETCMTLNFAPGWGYLKHSLANKTAGEVLHNLVNAVRLGGSFLFNVGPGPDGFIDKREVTILNEIGRWMRKHGEAIYGTFPERIYPLGKAGQGPCYHYGMWTCKGSTAYFTFFYYPGDGLIISKVGPKIKSAALLTTGMPLQCESISNSRTVIKGLPSAPPDPLAPVIKFEFEAPPYAIETPGAEWLFGGYKENS